MWEPIQCYQTHSNCYLNTTEMKIRGVLFHSTGANNPYIKRYVQPYETDENYDEMIELIGKNTSKNDYNHKTSWRQGMNAVIGKLADETVATVQTMPWNYRPWGCASGKNGSCNNGWVQFEICEDALKDAAYFNKIYDEACHLAAYVCHENDLDPMGTVLYNGVKVPVITCHCEAHVLGFASNHRDVLHWFKKYGKKSMDDVRADVQRILETEYKKVQEPPVYVTIYRVRKDWNDPKSQIGAFNDLNKAIRKCEQAGPSYKVYNMSGEIVYSQTFEVGEIVKVVGDNAIYESGKKIPAWVKKSKLFVRLVRSDGMVIISTKQKGSITGAVDPKYLERA